MTSKFRPGDKVRVSGGVSMHVNEVKAAEDGSVMYTCMWLEGAQPRMADFAEALLSKCAFKGGTKKISSFG